MQKIQSTLALILAAGEGTRMKSDTTKVAHPILGRPLLAWVIDACAKAGITNLGVVVGNQADDIKALAQDAASSFGYSSVSFALQKERKGTGHALMCARELIEQSGCQSVLVLFADSPLVYPETLTSLISSQQEHGRALELLSFIAQNPFGYGRIIRDESGAVKRIVEEKDATDQEKLIAEANAGSCSFDTKALLEHLDSLDNNNAQGEYYMTDMVKIFDKAGLKVGASLAKTEEEALGVNNRVQLWNASRILQMRINTQHMLKGVSFIDPTTSYIGPEVEIGQDSTIWPNTILQGKTFIGSHSNIGPNTRIKDSQIGSSCTVEESIILESQIDDEVSIGPRAYLRPQTHMMRGSKAGTHVEIKKSTIKEGAKVPHLSYIGDSTVGRDANIGAGTITCNYDGVNKHHTEIGDKAFIGSSTMLVAPVTIGNNSITGAGSVISKDVPENSLALERSEQVIKQDYVLKKRSQDK